MMSKKLSVSVLACCLALGASNLLWAAPEATPEALKETQAAIAAAQKAIVERQQAQQSIQKSLNQTEAALKQQQAEYDRLNKQHKLKWDEAKALQVELNLLVVKAQNNRAQLSRMLNAYYKNRYPEAVILLLNNDDPNKKGRNLKYMQYMVDADKKVINELRQQQQKVGLQQAQVNAELKKLDALVKSKNEVLSKLKHQGATASANSQKVNADIQKQTDLIKELRGNERRLNNIITSLAQKRAAEARQKAFAEQALKKEAEQRAAEAKKKAETQKKANDKKLSEPSTVEVKPTTPPVVVSPPPAKAKQEDFGRKQGQIQLPVQGKITGRYGTTKASGGSWKGLFISTPAQSVAVVANGEVVYANDLQGYGQTIIIDHGNNYLSVYTGLSQISVSVGQHLNSRQKIGVTGSLASGETGLYFEIRYLSQAINPLTWTN